jgi:uncharacterized protein
MFIRFFAMFVFFVFSATLHAASFDCVKAVSVIEKTICSDKELSDLDSDLGKLFYSLKGDLKSVIEDQKLWLRNTRNRCEDVDCLKSVYLLRISYLKSIYLCPATDKNILGSWVRVKNGFFEEMSFSENDEIKNFSSWLHHRPELNGTWVFSNCSIQIEGASGGVSFVLKVLKMSDKEMQIFDEDEQKSAIYRRIAR